MLARAADGSLRDALSLLDQAIVYGSGSVTANAVTGMLGTVAQQPVVEIMQALTAGNPQTLLQIIANTSELSPDYQDLLQQLLRLLHQLAIAQHSHVILDGEFDQQLLKELCSQLSPEDVQLYYQIGLIGGRDLPLAPDPRSGFEMIMLRMLTFKPETAQQQTQEAVRSTPSVSLPPQADQNASEAIALTSSKIQNSAKTVNAIAEQPEWQELISAMNLNGRTKELANNCVLDKLDEQQCRLLLDPSFQQVGNRAEENLKNALQQHFGRTLKLQIVSQTAATMTPAAEQQQQREHAQSNAVTSIHTDPNIQHLKDHFDARVLSGSIEPNQSLVMEKE